jgi:hypothetical protein
LDVSATFVVDKCRLVEVIDNGGAQVHGAVNDADHDNVNLNVDVQAGLDTTWSLVDLRIAA